MQAIWLITTGARESAFRNIKTIAECLADELINAAKGSSNRCALVLGTGGGRRWWAQVDASTLRCQGRARLTLLLLQTSRKMWNWLRHELMSVFLALQLCHQEEG